MPEVRCVVSTFLPELVFSVLSHELKPKGNVDHDTFTTFSDVANYIVCSAEVVDAPPAEPSGCKVS